MEDTTFFEKLEVTSAVNLNSQAKNSMPEKSTNTGAIPGEVPTGFLEQLVPLSATELRTKFPSEYTSWRNMKCRAKNGQCKVAPELNAFKSFLGHLGPKPGGGHTLDRIDPNDPLYGPGRVRWADKKTQAQNKTNTVKLTVDGVTQPLVVWAEATGHKPATLRARLKNGWTHSEVVYGRNGDTRLDSSHAFSIWTKLIPPNSSVTPEKLEAVYRVNRWSPSAGAEDRETWFARHALTRLHELHEWLAEHADEEGVAPEELSIAYEQWRRAFLNCGEKARSYARYVLRN